MTSLRQQMVDAMRQRGFSERTHRSYLGAVRDLARFHGRSPAELGIPELEQYFRHLAVERGLSGASCRVHRNAVRFLYLHALNGWVQLHPEVLYRRLFQVTWDTLRRFGQDPRRLGGEPGMTAVLHTWGQNLSQHVHLTAWSPPGGALQTDGQWKPSRGHTLFPVRALSRRFRGAMVAALRRAANEGELHRVTHPGEIDAVLDRLMATEWVVYARHCLDHSATVVDYLARYTHRIAISNARILDIDAREVTFRYTDYRDHNRTKVMRMGGEEFVRRFLLHILPKGLMRVRRAALRLPRQPLSQGQTRPHPEGTAPTAT